MVVFYRFLSDYEGLIYLVLLVGGAITARWLWRSWRESNRAIYGLEREMAQRRFARAVAAFSFVVALFLGMFIIASFIIPSMPPSSFIATPTINLLVSPTGTISAELAATLSAAPTVAADDISDGCIPDKLTITSPAPGANVSGSISIVGTIDIPDFGFYKFELAPRDTDDWSTFYAGREAIVDNELGRLNTGELIPGDYSLRLVVIDNKNNILPACEIPIQVVSE